MKNRFIFVFALLAFLLFGGTSFALDIPADVGEIKGNTLPKRVGEQVRVYKLVRFSSTAVNGPNIASNDVLVYDTVSDDGITVRLTTTSADAAIAGIAVMTIQTSDSLSGTSAYDDAGRRNWGYMLVHGKGTVKTSAGGTNGHSIGDRFITSTDSGAVTAFEAFNITGDTVTVAASNTNARRNIRLQGHTGGFFFDAADGTSTSYEVFINLE